MSGVNYDLRIQKGETFLKSIRWLDATGQPKPIGGWSGRMQIKRDYTANSPILLELTTQNGEIAVAPGSIIVQLSSARTASLPIAVQNPRVQPSVGYFYDLFVMSPDQSTVKRFLYGQVFVTGSLTDVD